MSRNKAYNTDDVLEKAMHVFWNNGYEQTSVRLLEKEMGINQFSIYSSFTSKHNLFVESLKKYREYVNINVYNDLLKPGVRLKDLEIFLNRLAEDKERGKEYKGCLVVNSTGEINPTDEEVTVELNNYYMFIREMLKKIISNSIDAGDISPDTDVDKHSSYLLGVMQGLSVGAKVLPENQVRDIIQVAFSVFT
ncbi:MAG: TetR/AcrR family transcriptional regulator [Bacteroidales bacterium]|nr:TetR/AcrR family transcriptional regulator [Bacteroidales bacterium]